MRRASLAIAIALAASLAAPALGAEVRLGFVDLHRAVNEVADGRAAKAKLKKEYDLRQKELDEKQEEVKQMQSDLQSRGDAMSDEARRKAQQELDQKVIEVGRFYQGLQKELAEKEKSSLQGIFAKMNGIIQNIAQQEGLTMVFEKSDSTLLYAQPALDLTNELIRRYNSQATKKKND
ncbi:MAG: OmpH/Skp family outer membrane protein [Deltaproteobacteria bacterium]